MDVINKKECALVVLSCIEMAVKEGLYQIKVDEDFNNPYDKVKQALISLKLYDAVTAEDIINTI